MVYQWRNKKRPVSAQAAGEELERIGAKNGKIEPKAVVDESRPKKAVLHPCFEWNDKKAAERWRVQQARNIIGDIIIIREEVPEAPPVRAFVNVQPLNQRGEFIHVDAASKQPDKWAIVKKNALAEMMQFEQKYAALIEYERQTMENPAFVGVFDAIEAAGAEREARA